MESQPPQPPHLSTTPLEREGKGLKVESKKPSIFGSRLRCEGGIAGAEFQEFVARRLTTMQAGMGVTLEGRTGNQKCRNFSCAG